MFVEAAMLTVYSEFPDLQISTVQWQPLSTQCTVVSSCLCKLSSLVYTYCSKHQSGLVNTLNPEPYLLTVL